MRPNAPYFIILVCLTPDDVLYYSIYFNTIGICSISLFTTYRHLQHKNRVCVKNMKRVNTKFFRLMEIAQGQID
jgi:hypothetical protein